MRVIRHIPVAGRWFDCERVLRQLMTLNETTGFPASGKEVFHNKILKRGNLGMIARLW